MLFVVACSDRPYTGPILGEGCAEDQQDRVLLEGDTRVVELFITREFTEVDLTGGTAVRQRHYRTCQAYSCSALREQPQEPLTEAETHAALAACRAEADAAWRAR